MGALESLPYLHFNFSSSCCNGEKTDKVENTDKITKENETEKTDKVDGGNLARSQSSSRLWRFIKTFKSKRERGKEDQKVVEQSAVIHIKPSKEN